MTKRKKHEPLIKEDWDSIPCPTCGGHGVLPKDGTLWRKERKRLGLSQQEVAAAMGVSHAYIGELERGTRRMTADVRKRFTDALENAVSLKEHFNIIAKAHGWKES